MSHEKYIRECFKLAKKARGQTSPNPLVGCVIVKNNKIIAKGFHKGSGLAHAELDAIDNAQEDLRGAILYSNLEPCCHTDKKTPPCAQRIISEGFSQVVISNLDPNPKVAGNGVKLLRSMGIEVITDVLKEEGEILNEIFFTHIVLKRPFIHLKWAQTLDAKMATLSSDSKWITSDTSRQNVHIDRSLYDAILVGAGTIIKDNPSLTIRLNGQEQCSKRIILAKKDLERSLYKVFNDQFKEKTILINYDQNIDLSDILNTAYRDHGICSLYVEGGAKIISAFLKQKLYDKVSVYIAPKIIGKGITYLEDVQNLKIQDSLDFKDISWMQIEKDILMTGYRKD